MPISKNVTYEYNGEYQSAIKRIATYLAGEDAEDPGYSSMEIIANTLLARVDAEAPEFASPMDAIAWAVENGAIGGGEVPGGLTPIDIGGGGGGIA